MCPPPQFFGCQLTLFGPRGADYARHITTGPPSFWTMRRLCYAMLNAWKKSKGIVILEISWKHVWFHVYIGLKIQKIFPELKNCKISNNIKYWIIMQCWMPERNQKVLWDKTWKYRIIIQLRISWPNISMSYILKTHYLKQYKFSSFTLVIGFKGGSD